MRLTQALAEVPIQHRTEQDPELRGIHYDSRRIRPGDLFLAMRGGTTDGNRFLPQAIAAGAAAIVTDSPAAYAQLTGIPKVLVEHGRRALAAIAANLLDHPERKLKVSAVTGTNGKTTTAFLLEQMLKSVGRKCVLIGTIETHIGNEIRPSEHTTPEASDLLQLFADGVAAGCTEVVMEMSSHALDQERVCGIPVDVAIFTNLTQDHLDYHGTMEKYAAAKAKLFRGVGAPPPRVAVINADDGWAATHLDMVAVDSGLRDRDIMLYEIDEFEYGNGEYSAERLAIKAGRTTYLWHTPDGSVEIESPLTGKVNVYNLLAASCAALARGLTLEQIQSAAANLHQVPGRFQVVQGSQQADFTVVVDYAHTDDALRNLITLARDLVATSSLGGKPEPARVITLFGCGGDRDRAKRPKMGRAAGELSDLVILTNDNPRTEDPAQILAEALAGIRETAAQVIVEPDRRLAIAQAIHAARPGDIVLLAGKGHEKVQIVGTQYQPFDDVAEAQKVLATLA